MRMFLRRAAKDDADRTCLVCGRRPGTVRIEGGYVCSYCVPMGERFDNPTAKEVSARHIKDPELLSRIDSFTETESFADLRFDDENGLFFKGPWPSYSIPILSYGEIGGYRITVDGVPTAFNSIGGKRALFKVCTDEFIRSAGKKIDSIDLDIDSLRENVRFSTYQIRHGSKGVCPSREDSLKLAIDVSRKLDSIIETNIMNGSSSNRK